LARLVLRDTYPAVDDIGAKHFDHVAAALAGVEQQRERKPLARPKRPAAFELCDLRIRPGVIGAEPIWFETREGIVCPYVGLDCIGHHLRRARARQFCHSGAEGADVLDDVPRSFLEKLAHEPVAMSGEYRLQGHAV